MKQIITIALLLIGLSAYAAEVPSATFSYFSYEGNDDYYNNHPLNKTDEFYNPILPGFYSDPSICRVDNDYWLVTSTFCYYPGVPLFHSTDLVNWEQVGNVLSRPSQLPHLHGQTIGTGGIYAPTIRYNERNRTYYMITTDVGKEAGHFYVTTKDPRGEWSDPVWLKDIDGIDPSFFFDDNGEAYIIYKENTDGQPKWSNHRAIRIIRFDVEKGTTVGESVKFNEEGVGPEEHLGRDEGPHLFKVNGKYYVICAEGGTSDFHSEVVYKADNVFGPYQRWGRNPMLTQRLMKRNRTNPITCTGHVDMVQKPDGQWWAVFLGMRPLDGKTESMGRETYLMPVKWSKDGFPYITQEKDSIPLVQQMPGITRNANVTYGNVKVKENFCIKNKMQRDHYRLAPYWMSLRGSIDTLCTITADGLRLNASAQKTTGKGTPAFLGRRIQNQKFTVETSLSTHLQDKSLAGILIFKTEQRQYFLATDGKKVMLQRIGKGYDTIAEALLPRDCSTIDMRIVNHGLTYDFLYRAKDADVWQTLAKDIDATYTSSSSGGFCGTTVGMYCEMR